MNSRSVPSTISPERKHQLQSTSARDDHFSLDLISNFNFVQLSNQQIIHRNVKTQIQQPNDSSRSASISTVSPSSTAIPSISTSSILSSIDSGDHDRIRQTKFDRSFIRDRFLPVFIREWPFPFDFQFFPSRTIGRESRFNSSSLPTLQFRFTKYETELMKLGDQIELNNRRLAADDG
jgi:hypothetical protein